MRSREIRRVRNERGKRKEEREEGKAREKGEEGDGWHTHTGRRYSFLTLFQITTICRKRRDILCAKASSQAYCPTVIRGQQV